MKSKMVYILIATALTIGIIWFSQSTLTDSNNGTMDNETGPAPVPESRTIVNAFSPGGAGFHPGQTVRYDQVLTNNTLNNTNETEGMPI